jgi:drug/metabolite transporter (DMT)-like permease
MDKVPGAGHRARGGELEAGRAAAEVEAAAGKAARAASGRAAPGSAVPGSMASGGAGEQAGRDRRVGWAALLVVWVLWGSTYFAIRVGVETIPPLLMAGTRYVIAGLLMFPLAVRSRVPGETAGSPAGRWGWRRGRGADRLRGADRPRARFWGSAAVVGTLLLAGGNGGVSVAERTVPSGLAALLLATVPLWLIIIDRVVTGTRIGLIATAGLVAGAVGVGFLSGLFGGSSHGGRGAVSVAGVVIILAASVTWASGTIASRRLPLPARPLLATSMQMLAGGVVLFVAAAIAGEFSGLDLGRVSTGSLLGLLWLIGPGSIIAFSAYVVAVRRLPTASVATYAYVNPIIAVILGTALLGETVTGPMLLGGALVVVAVVLVLRAQAVRSRAR